MTKVLEFSKSNVTFAVTETIIIATKFINTRLCKIILHTNGTTIDATEKVNRVVRLDDMMFESFDRIRRSQDD